MSTDRTFQGWTSPYGGFVAPARGWLCEESPLGVCIYHDAIDRMHDNCLFCHEPEERK